MDRYDEWLVMQFLSAGIEPYRDEIINALLIECQPRGILARDDVRIRSHEGLSSGVHLLHGNVPDVIEVREAAVRLLASPWTGQKTGAFLDQRENRVRAGTLARGRALDAFAYHGGFALHLAHAGAQVTALESSAEAVAHARHNARLLGLEDRIEFVEANVFDTLREMESQRLSFNVIVLDPPAFAKRRDSLDSALRGYKEINLRAMKLLAPGGSLLTFSCSYHVGPNVFRAMLEDAAADARRPLRWMEWRSQSPDHPVIIQIPETSYLKGALLTAEGAEAS